MTEQVDEGSCGTAGGRRVVHAGYQGNEGSFGARAAARCGKPVALPPFEALLAALG